MALPRVFVDGHAGTTGLRIREWLTGRADLEILEAPAARRKDPAVRAELLNRADAAILCLPDDAAREAVALLESGTTRVIDASTAHRVDSDWVYGLPELSPEQRRALTSARRVSNPGCYPTTVILGLRPLIDTGLLSAEAPITVHALSGYSGGGRAMIERWEDPAGRLRALPHEAPYAMDRRHKHLPEMTRHSGLAHAPYFLPSVGPFRCGMRVEIPLHADVLGPHVTGRAIREALAERYASERFVKVAPLHESIGSDEFVLDPQACNDTNRIELHVVPHPDGHVLLVGLLDNLGKGASGAAIQCLNLMLRLDESTGLRA